MRDSAFVDRDRGRRKGRGHTLVQNTFEAEAVGRRGGARGPAIQRRQHRDEGVHGPQPASDLQQCTNDDPHRGVQESIGLDHELPDRTLPTQLGPPDAAERPARLERGRAAQTRRVVLSDQRGAGCFHRGAIQARIHQEMVAPEEGIALGGEAVGVDTARGRVAGVEAVGCHADRTNGHVRWNDARQRPLYALEGIGVRQDQRTHLPTSVYARIGTAGTGRQSAQRREFPECTHEFALDRAQTTRLHLPPVEMRALVGEVDPGDEGGRSRRMRDGVHRGRVTGSRSPDQRRPLRARRVLAPLQRGR